MKLAGAPVKQTGRGGRYACHPRDVNGDGLIDLACEVWTAQLALGPGDSVAVLTGQTFAGTAIQGQDAIRLVP